MKELLAWYHALPPVWSNLLETGVILLLTFVVSMILLIVSRKTHARLKKTSNVWDDILIQALHKPLQTFVWVAGVLTACEHIFDLVPHFSDGQFFFSAREIVAVLAFVWFLLRYIRLFEDKFTKAAAVRNKKIDKATTFAVSQLLRIAVAIVALLLIIQMAGVPISGIVAFGGAGALVFGLAAKDLLANFFGGLMIFTDRPFTVGDWISSPDRAIEGTVEKIGWRLTRLRSFERRPLFVPNSIFSTIIVVNPSRMYNRRIKTTIGVRYDDFDKVRAIGKDITEMLKAHPAIDQNQTMYVRFINYGDYTLDIQIYTFTKTTDWVAFMEIQEDVLLKVGEIVTEHGAEIAFPTQTIEVPKDVNIKKVSDEQTSGMH